MCKFENVAYTLISITLPSVGKISSSSLSSTSSVAVAAVSAAAVAAAAGAAMGMFAVKQNSHATGNSTEVSIFMFKTVKWKCTYQ